MRTVTLSKAETMLYSIAETERSQVLQQVNANYQARLGSIADSHGFVNTDGPFSFKVEGESVLLIAENAAETTKPALVPDAPTA